MIVRVLEGGEEPLCMLALPELLLVDTFLEFIENDLDERQDLTSVFPYHEDLEAHHDEADTDGYQ